MAKKPAKKAAPQKPAAPKAIKEALSKSGLVAHIAESSGVAAKDVRAVLASLESAVHGSVSSKGINPFTKEEQWFAAKPATVKVKVRPLKKLKDAAA